MGTWVVDQPFIRAGVHIRTNNDKEKDERDYTVCLRCLESPPKERVKRMA